MRARDRKGKHPESSRPTPRDGHNNRKALQPVSSAVNTQIPHLVSISKCCTTPCTMHQGFITKAAEMISKVKMSSSVSEAAANVHELKVETVKGAGFCVASEISDWRLSVGCERPSAAFYRPEERGSPESKRGGGGARWWLHAHSRGQKKPGRS